jgi:hypothetical protein
MDDREAMNRAAARILEAQRRSGNSRISHEEIKNRIIQARKKRGKE